MHNEPDHKSGVPHEWPVTGLALLLVLVPNLFSDGDSPKLDLETAVLFRTADRDKSVSVVVELFLVYSAVVLRTCLNL